LTIVLADQDGSRFPPLGSIIACGSSDADRADVKPVTFDMGESESLAIRLLDPKGIPIEMTGTELLACVVVHIVLGKV
jgi:hypothetical protein